jgi:hopanoid biosynthesis associated RND transporter like protein HpnN
VSPADTADGKPGRIGRLLSSWAGIASRGAPLVLLLAIAAAATAALIATRRLGIDTNTVDMLSADLPWRIENERHKRLFPHYADNIVIVISGATGDLAAEAQRSLTARLREEPEAFEYVHAVGGGPFFDENGLLYEDLEDLEDLAEGLEEAGPWLADLERRPDLIQFLAVLDSMLEVGSDPAPGSADRSGRAIDLLGAVGQAFDGSMVGRVQPLPWRSLLGGRSPEPEHLRRYIEVIPRIDYERLFPGAPAIERIRMLADSLGLTGAAGVRIRLTGFIPMSDEELRSSIAGLETAGLLALIMVGLALWAGLRSVRLIVAGLITLFVGLLLTAAFAALAVGRLNLISMAFAVLYIGLGIDYAIHFSLRYRELRTEGSSNRTALRRTGGDVGASLFLSAITTAACFFAFVPTDFEGVSELGVIGGAGMLISFATTITLLPALATLLPFRVKPGEKPLVGGVLPAGVARGLAHHRRTVLVVAALVGLLSLVLLPRARFDLDPLTLRNPDGEATATFLELLADSTTRPLTASILAPDREGAQELVGELERLEVVEAALTVDDFIPGDQEAKLEVIERIGRALGSAPEADTASPGTLEAGLAEVDRFRQKLRDLEFDGDEADRARFAAFQIRSWQRWLEGLPEGERRQALSRVEESLVGGVSRSLRDLRAALADRSIVQDDLPAELVVRWVAPGGERRVEVVPAADLRDRQALRTFVTDIRAVAPRATGEPVINVSAAEAVVVAFRRALANAAVATFILLLISLRSLRDALRVMIPLLLAAAMTGAATVLSGLAFNYANVIALPLLLGVGVDNGIHMVHRSRASPDAGGGLLGTSTARAVLYASLTTIFSFGNLAFSGHPGTASMGRLLTVGMLAVLVCTLFVLPALQPASRRGSVPAESSSAGVRPS